jgi:hypothetical protein
MIFEQSWNASNYKRRKLECKFRVDGKKMNEGIFGVIRRMKLRRQTMPPFDCIDYVQLKYANETYSERICGMVDKFTYLSFDDNGGSIRVKLVVDTSLVLDSELASLELSMVFTGYDGEMEGWGDPQDVSYNFLFPECDEDRTFSCFGPNTYEKCIISSLVKDGIPNCPSPGCLDESGCHLAEVEPVFVPTSSIILSALTSLIFTMCGVGCCVYICLKYYKCVRTFGRDLNENTTSSTAPHNQQPIELQVRTTPRGSIIISPAQESPTPTPDEAKDLPPSYDSLFPAR